MSEDIDYHYLFYVMRWVIRGAKELGISCVCKDCKYAKRAIIYFKMLKYNVDNHQLYTRICDLIMNEEDTFIDNYIYSFLENVDEDEMMETLFNDKETLSNDIYILRCNALMNVKKFKNIMTKKNKN